MSVIHIDTERQLDALLSSAKIVVIDFFATWCGPCQRVAPLFESAAMTYAQHPVVFVKVDVDRNPDISVRFSIQAMPTFVVVRNNVTIATHKGANIDAVLNIVEQELRSMPPPAAAANATGGSAQGVAGSSGPNGLLHALARAVRCAAGSAEADAALSDAFSRIEKDATPLGIALVPLLSSPLWEPAMLSRLLQWIDGRPAPLNADGAAMIHAIHSHLTSSLSWQSWKDVNNVASMVKMALRNLLMCPEAQAIIVGSSRYVPRFTGASELTGRDLQLKTTLGAVFGVTNVASRAIMQEIQLEKLSLFPCENPGRLNRRKADESTAFLHREIERAIEENFSIVREMLKPASRARTLEWMALMIEKNVDYGKEMQKEHNLSNIISMVVFANVCVELALPVVSAPEFPKNVPVQYVYDPNALVGMAASSTDVERVARLEKEQYPAVDENVAAYKPGTHLFFLALRALSLTYTSLLSKIQLYQRQIRHPSVPDNERNFIAALIGFDTALLTPPGRVKKVMQFMNGAARWLTSQIGIQRDGTVPRVAPLQWQMMPQQILDDVIRSTQVLSSLRVQLDPYDFADIVGLMLVTMGNTTFMPKAHTHALFPELLIMLMSDPQFAPSVQNHPWFQANIVKNCIACYIVMEKCIYDRTPTRYYLSLVLKDVLKDKFLCAPARELFENVGSPTADDESATGLLNSSNTLERFASMVTAETNQCLDSSLNTLAEMHNKETENGGAPPVGNEEYDQKGRELKDALMLFSTSVSLFQALTEQFPRGVTQVMVQQQISSMLTRSIVKLAGPNSRELKLADPLKYGFDPRKLVNNMVECYVYFRTSATFAKCVCESGIALPEVHYAIDNICNRPLVSEYLAVQLRQMQDAVRAAEEEQRQEQSLWDDAPDDFLCALLSYPLTDFLALPTSGEDLTFVNREAIAHQLLQEEVNPFNRQKLTQDELNAFNERPEIKAKVRERKDDIRRWLDAKRRQSQSQPSGHP